MSQRKEKYARGMERRVASLENVVSAQKERIVALEENQTEQYIARIIDDAYAQRAEQSTDMKIRRYRRETKRAMTNQMNILLFTLALAIVAVIISMAAYAARAAEAEARPAVTEQGAQPESLEEYAQDIVVIRWAGKSDAISTEYIDAVLEIAERPENAVSVWTR